METFAKLQQAYRDSVLSRAQSLGSCAFRLSLNSQNYWGRVEFESQHCSSDFDQLNEDEKDLRQNGSEKHFSVNRFLVSKNIPVAPQPPYSPDLSPCDFFLFLKLKNHPKGQHFGTKENIQTAVTDQLKAIPISEFHQCYEEWKKRLQRCVASEGSYFEGDNVEFCTRAFGDGPRNFEPWSSSWTTPELAPPLTTTPHQREDISALDRFSVHRCPTRWVFSGTGLELVTKPATIRCQYHSATAAWLEHRTPDRKA
ncbi:uncharacterized protein TNCV_40731 [Trichonephila clavipes]|nr:uncharacterized protein TNCV_40731 [Trichonephila clavipes]